MNRQNKIRKDEASSVEVKQRVDDVLRSKAALHFRDRIRDARAAALRDAENFEEILFCVESLGSFLRQRVESLHKYRTHIRGLALRSVFSEKLPNILRGHHLPFDQLYEALRIARNDAFHQGARVRHLTESAVQLAMILEDALMTTPDTPKDFLVSDFMIRNPVCAELWQPVSVVRQVLLINSFSYLSIMLEEDGKKSFYLIGLLGGSISAAGSERKIIGSIEINAR